MMRYRLSWVTATEYFLCKHYFIDIHLVQINLCYSLMSPAFQKILALVEERDKSQTMNSIPAEPKVEQEVQVVRKLI